MKTILIWMGCLVFALSSCESSMDVSREGGDLTAARGKVAPKDWDEWALWADKLHATGDGQGHGPDVGSDEWAQVLDRQLNISDQSGHGPDVGSVEWRSAVEARLLKR
ncbi:MAG: hypothetical protein L3J39_14515 [Verrucomicrobiales bacterium]|nr:hypothetical protein [Verrucomicrobiales bacterium]